MGINRASLFKRVGRRFARGVMVAVTLSGIWLLAFGLALLFLVLLLTLGLGDTIYRLTAAEELFHAWANTSPLLRGMSSEEAQAFFAQINKLTLYSPEALVDLTYEGQALLNAAEIQHLNSAHRLIWNSMLILNLGGLALLGLTRFRGVSWVGLALLPGVLISLIVAIGVEQAYAAFHSLFFPGEQWFFYYEDSAMVVLLNAPVYFYALALLGALLALSVASLLLIVTKRLQPRQPGQCGYRGFTRDQ